MTTETVRPGETWAIEAPDSRATWRPAKVIELISRNRAVVEPLSGPDRGKQIKVKVETFIEKLPTEAAINRYAESHIRADKLGRHRPDHDRDTAGRPLRGAP